MRHDLPCKTSNSTLHATTPDSTFFGLYKKDCRHTSLSRLPYCCRVPKIPSYCKKRFPHSPAIGRFTIDTGKKRILPRTFSTRYTIKAKPRPQALSSREECKPQLVAHAAGLPRLHHRNRHRGKDNEDFYKNYLYGGGGKSATITNFEAERRMCPTDRGTRPHKN